MEIKTYINKQYCILITKPGKNLSVKYGDKEYQVSVSYYENESWNIKSFDVYKFDSDEDALLYFNDTCKLIFISL